MARASHNHPGASGFRRQPGTVRSIGSQCGFTYVELMMVLIIIAALATVMMPSMAPSQSIKLDLAATELADAMRFARSEAMRLGVERGFHQKGGETRIRVFSMNTETSPATPVYDVYHPIDKQIYDRQLDQQPFAFDGNIKKGVSFRGNCNKPENIYFDANGTPWCADPADVLLVHIDLMLYFGTEIRHVFLNGITGRVTVQ